MGRSLSASAVAVALLGATALVGATPLGAQDRLRKSVPGARENGAGRAELTSAAAAVRAAWLAHDAATVVGGSAQLVVQLPGADPSAALDARQAAALLSDFFDAAREVDLVVREIREVDSGTGYVEMARRYRVDGTQDVRAQNLFLSYRRAKQSWVLVELRAIEP